MNNLSVVLATKNEESNIGSCLESFKGIADEIIIFDEFSTDKTREIAKKYNAKVFKYQHRTNFHETKQRATNKAAGDWILQLDADERVTPKLAEEIKSVLNDHHSEFISESFSQKTKDQKEKLFSRHQKLVNRGEFSTDNDADAYFIPRLNFFLGKPLIHAGVYPNGVIRLFKKGKAHLPGRSVHELMEVDGKVGWLFNDLEHHDSPTFSRYFERANRYTDLTAQEFKSKYKSKTSYWDLFNYSFFVPTIYFLSLYIRHQGYKDGMRGFVWSAFSALHYPIAYFKYYSSQKNNTYPSKL
jgi:glycosyltransferase involved in cell wall biosynthesis